MDNEDRIEAIVGELQILRPGLQHAVAQLSSDLDAGSRNTAPSSRGAESRVCNNRQQPSHVRLALSKKKPPAAASPSTHAARHSDSSSMRAQRAASQVVNST